jgi:hypothetical protein
MAFYLLFVLLLLYLTYQDWKNRSVYWIIFPVLFVLNLYLNYIPTVYIDFLLNISIVLLQLTSIIIYLKIKGLRLSELFSKYFGFGDLLFLVVLSLSFKVDTFLIFNIVSLVFAILFSLMLKLKSIPFAGIQSFFLSVYIIYNHLILG